MLQQMEEEENNVASASNPVHQWLPEHTASNPFNIEPISSMSNNLSNSLGVTSNLE